jgi:hypothetical protein
LKGILGNKTPVAFESNSYKQYSVFQTDWGFDATIPPILLCEDKAFGSHLYHMKEQEILNNLDYGEVHKVNN